ncbi:hypothetical protein F5144DRAFT_594535 [Chaetomium tenue]|uniref:Uncharacterized protein n=1 Tax=Chaetomium tenue TaxID=1854479 RepID=A0ACB7P5S3_9PEZI|nr:hypothetical protein F5144DRAFT_594535 [Chaetomium globosum]
MDQLANKKDRRLAELDDVSCYLLPLSLTIFPGGLPFGVYAIAQNFNIPLQVQPQIFMALCLVSWAQILLYHRYGTFRGSHPRGHSLMLHDSNWPAWKASLLGLAVAVVFAGVEAALIITLKPIYDQGNEVPITVVGIIAAVLLAAGLLPPYGELWKRRGRVIGINWLTWGCFVAELTNAVTQNTFDVLGGVLYIVCCILEIGIFSSHLIWLARTRKIRKAAAAEGKTFDDVVAEHEMHGTPFNGITNKPGGKRQEIPTDSGEAQMQDVKRDS